RSPPTRRIATNGNRNAAASSHALNVGAQIPMSGENASPTPATVPFNPLASPYVWTALMNETPTSGPIAASITHHARDTISSRHSLPSSHPYAVHEKPRALCEGKEHLFQIRGTRRVLRARRECRQLVQRSFAADAAGAQQDEAIAHARRFVDLVNR